ncbi:MAG: protein kinase domain-containing protein [Geodermatophilaceae bacterium]
MTTERGYAQAPAATEVFGSYTFPEHSPTGFALDVGDSLQIWTITARVNAGINAHVYRASDPDALSGRDVALKVLLPQSAHGRQDQVVHEVAAMSSLTLGHPHLMASTIARRINTGPYVGGVLIVMPWASLNLREYVLAIRRGDALPDDGRWARPTAMCEALAGIADGLAQLHDLQTAHGDVKPDNIMLVEGVWKLGDFGLTRPMEGSYVLSAPGTLSYTAPEEARAQHADPAAEIKRRPAGDVWALGVTLHFAVTGGRFPMPGITPDERLAAVRQGVIQISPEIRLPELRHLLADQLLVDDLHREGLSYERRINAAQAGESLRRIAATEHLPTARIRIDSALGSWPDNDAMLRYRGQCERVSAQTVELWRDLGPWDSTHAATTNRSRGVLRTMLANRLSGLEPPPELRLRKSVFARTLGLRAPYEACRIAARENAIARYAPPIEDSGRVARRMVAVSAMALSLTALGAAAGNDPGAVTLAAGLMVGVVALLVAVGLGGRFPEPAYVFGSRSGPLFGALVGVVLGMSALALPRAVAGSQQVTSAGLSGSEPFITLVLLPGAAAVGLLGWYGAGVLATRHAVLKQRRAANPPPGG